MISKDPNIFLKVSLYAILCEY